MFKFLAALSAVSVVIGLFSLPGTTGIGLIAVGCYLAIVARLVQAEGHLRNVSRQEEVSKEGSHSKSDRWLWAVGLFLAVLLGVAWLSEKQNTRPALRSTTRSQPAHNNYITPAPRDTYTGQITQTGVGEGSGMFYIVLDDFVQCFFRDQDLPGEKRKMQQFQNSSALRLTVSGAPAPDQTPLLGDIRYDACRIEGWE